MSSLPNVDSILRRETEMQREGEEDDERLRTQTQTVDCLRGRLLAERAASRDANLTAHFFHSKLTELEKRLKIETKLRKKAESRLNKLKDKLQSLNIIDFTHQSTSSDHSHSHSGESCISSIDDISNSAQITAHPENDYLLYKTKEISNCGVTCFEQQQQQLTDNNLHGLKTLALEEKKSEVDDEEVDNSMALVVVDCYQETEELSSGGVVEVRRETVRDVLNSLKQIKETLRCSLDTSHIIRV